MELTFCFPPHSPFTLKEIEENCSVVELKLKLFSIIPGISGETEGEEMRLVCGGRVLQDHLNLIGQGVVSGAKIYVAIKKNSQGKQSPSPAMSQRKTESDPLMEPLLKFLSDNPELYQQMIMSNPQMQKLIEKNPELRHALSDPSTLKSMLNAATNPKAYNEMLRGHDRAMSNLENIPEGFSHLKKVYSTLQEPMYDAFTPKTRVNFNEIANEEGRIRTTTNEPIPNPWAPKKIPVRSTSSSYSTSTSSRSGANKPIFGAQKRKLNASIDEDEELFNRSLAGIADMGLTSPLTRKTDLYSQQLMEMHLLGFINDEENVAALMESDGDVSVAIDRIMAKRGNERK